MFCCNGKFFYQKRCFKVLILLEWKLELGFGKERDVKTMICDEINFTDFETLDVESKSLDTLEDTRK